MYIYGLHWYEIWDPTFIVTSVVPKDNSTLRFLVCLNVRVNWGRVVAKVGCGASEPLHRCLVCSIHLQNISFFIDFFKHPFILYSIPNIAKHRWHVWSARPYPLAEVQTADPVDGGNSEGVCQHLLLVVVAGQWPDYRGVNNISRKFAHYRESLMLSHLRIF